MDSLHVFGVKEIPEVQQNDDISKLIFVALENQGLKLQEKDIIIVASKIVSKAEGLLINESSVNPSLFAVQLAESTNRDPRQVEVVLKESSRPVKISDQALIMETSHGFVCANAGVDQSNIEKGNYLLLPKDPDRSARQIRQGLENLYNINLAVIITDTFGRPWREGQTNIAIGVSGMKSIKYYKGQEDTHGNELNVTAIAIADQIAGTAELISGKTNGLPVSVMRGYHYEPAQGSAKELIRPRGKDLFR